MEGSNYAKYIFYVFDQYQSIDFNGFPLRSIPPNCRKTQNFNSCKSIYIRHLTLPRSLPRRGLKAEYDARNSPDFSLIFKEG